MQLQGRNLKLNIQGADVHLLHIELQLLGYTIVGDEVQANRFSVQTKQAVQAFQRGHDLEPTGVVDEATAAAIARAVEALFVVQGTVRGANQKPVRGALVRAYDKDLRQEQLLGEAKTDEQGAYRISYTAAQFRRAEKQRADLLVRVYAPEAPGLLLATSDLVFNAEPRQTVDLIVEQRYSRFELDMAAIEPLRENVAVAELSQQDAAFLARETGVPAARLERLAVAARLAGSTQVEPAVFYGLISQKLPATRSELLEAPPDTLRRALVASLDEHLIPARLRDELDAIMASLARLARVDAGIQTRRRQAALDRLGAIAGLSAGKQALLRDKVRNPARLDDKALKALVKAQELTDVEARRLGLTASLYQLCDEQADLAEKLKGHRFPHLNGRRLKHLTDLIPLEEQDWVEVVKGANLPFPDDTTPEAYAATLSKRIARLYPSDTLLARVTPRKEVVAGLNKDLEELQEYFGERQVFSVGPQFVDELDAGVLPDGLRAEFQNQKKPLTDKAALSVEEAGSKWKIVDKGTVFHIKVENQLLNVCETKEKQPRFSRRDPVLPIENESDETKKQTLRQGYDRLLRLANTHPGLRVHELLDDPQLSADDKIKAIEGRLGLLERVQELNPTTEFLALDYTVDSQDVADLKFNGLDDVERRMVLANWKAYQRGYLLTHDVDHTRTLMACGYHNAAGSIVSDGYRKFKQTTGFSDSVAEEIYDNAKNGLMKGYQAVGAAIDASQDPIRYTQVGNRAPSTQAYLRQIDGYEALFGSLDYCDCQHCRSIFGPAAYFVDLMQYVEKNLLEKTFAPGLEGLNLHLKNRRPDLWTLPLTCENTNKLVPYLDIINEILENYIAREFAGIDVVALEGDAGVEDPRQVVEDAVYGQAFYEDKRDAADPKNIHSFRQPFMLPLEELEVYLNHFDTTRAGIAALLGEEKEIVAAAVLGMSGLEYELVRTANANRTFLEDLYGLDFGSRGVEFHDPDLRPDAADYEQSRDRSKNDVQLLLTPIGVTRAELGELAATSFVLSNSVDSPGQAARTILIEGDKRDAESVQNDIERISGLTLDHLDRLHRFVRLWRRVPWSIRELDLVLYHLRNAESGRGAKASMLLSIARLLGLQKRFSLPVEALCALWGDIPQTPVTDGQRSLLDRLFNIPPFERLDGKFPNPRRPFVHPALRSDADEADDAAAHEAENHTLNRLLAGLRVTDGALYQLIIGLGRALGVDISAGDIAFSPAIHELSLLYRHARLAEHLRLSVPDLFQLIALAAGGADGHTAALDSLVDGHVAGLDSLVALLDFYDWWQTTDYSLDELGYITNGRVLNAQGYPDLATISKQFLADVRAEGALQFADTVFTYLDGVTEEKSRAIVKDPANRPVFEPVSGVEYRLAAGFDVEDLAIQPTPLLVTEGITATEDDIRAILRDLVDPSAPVFANTLFWDEGVVPTVEESRTIFAANPGVFVLVPETTTYALNDEFVIDRMPLIVPVGITATDAMMEVLRALAAPGAPTFSDEVFTSIESITDQQARELFDTNEGTIFRSVTSDKTYWLRPGDVLASLTIPQDTPALRAAAAALLANYEANRVIPTYLARQLKLPAEKVAAMIRLTGADLSQADYVNALRSGRVSGQLVILLDQVLRLAVLFKGSVYDAAAIDFIGENERKLGIDGLRAASISMGEVQTLSIYERLAKLGEDEAWAKTLREVLKAFDAAATTRWSGDGTVAALATIVQAETSLVKTLLPTAGLPDNPLAALDKLRRCVEAAQYLGVGGSALRQIASEAYGDLAQASRAVLGAFRAKYPDEAQWEEKIEPFEDKIRSRKRDALVDYLLHHPELHYRNEHDLYQYFLIDVELEGCARTSRLVAATNSVQLYVHRCIMHLEQSEDEDGAVLVVFDEDDPDGRDAREEWEWRKNYRVWEANRKVFLYPENYLEPDLRDDKTPLFEELESQLLQGEINEQTVLDAYTTYLRGFEEVARLKIAGSYYNQETDTLHLFGITADDPLVYYYRTVEHPYYLKGTTWHPWRKIDLQIPVKKVAPIVFRGRLYVFWVEIVTIPKNDLDEGTSRFVGYKHTLSLKYAMLRLDGTWTPAQKVTLDSDDPSTDEGVIEDLLAEERVEYVPESGYAVTPMYGSDNDKHSFGLTVWSWPSNGAGQGEAESFFIDVSLSGLVKHKESRIESKDKYTLRGFQWDQVYPGKIGDDVLYVTGANFELCAPIDLYERRIGDRYGEELGPFVLVLLSVKNDRHLYVSFPDDRCPVSVSEYALASFLADQDRFDDIASTARTDAMTDLASEFEEFDSGPIARLKDEDEIAFVNGSWGDYIIDSRGDLLYLQRSIFWYRLLRLGTTLSETMARKLSTDGVPGLLDTTFQESGEMQEEAASTVQALEEEEEIFEQWIANAVNAGELDFTGSYGVYYREIFLHVPFLIANHLNSQQKFAEAQKWYHYIFDPTSSEVIPKGDPDLQPEDRNWRYLEFRQTGPDTLRELLTEPAAIEIYKDEPFSPHAIARQRLSLGPYKRAVVMKYIDNLLDWGDHLFAQDTMESINEATMLYVLAADILGERPAKVGSCGELPAEELTYENIVRESGSAAAEFLVEMEHFVPVRPTGADTRKKLGQYMPDQAGMSFAEALRKEKRDKEAPKTDGRGKGATGPLPLLGGMVRQIGPAFCIPANEQFLEYWDRVEDRLYKIRHCMNISGVRRELALFAPEIDPMLLVRARAAGLSLDDVLDAINGDLPPYRFLYLIERAKSYAATLQSFGAALLGALEKKDNEELSRLRVTHQQNILKLTTRMQQWEYDAAEIAVQAGLKRKESIQYRKSYFEGLVSDGLIDQEQEQAAERNDATSYEIAAETMNIFASMAYLVPQLGSFFALTFGGKELGDSLTTVAQMLRSSAAIARSCEASAALEASFERRSQEWGHQVQLAQHDINEVEKQIEIAEIRRVIANRSIEIHNKAIEQADEIWELYNDKFTTLGLYTWLSQELQKLYRQAYGNAYAMARLAERAYRFERGDETGPWLAANYWEASRAGLLAGERLLLDLQNLERRFIETNYRSLEIDQAFSLTQVAPAALLALKATGECTFEIPELFFDLFYPGHYKRKIKAVRLTIPCVTGPYTNVSTSLELVQSKIRTKPELGDQHLKLVPRSRSISIATSTAQNDAGVFELSFRDERYMPFEGAGAISTWNLSLPKSFRPFDYETINDVILHISYTAEADGGLRDQVERLSMNMEYRLADFLGSNSLYRVFSLRQEFSGQFHQLLMGHVAQIEITDKHFPIFLRGKTLAVQLAKLVLGTELTELADLEVSFNGTNIPGFDRHPDSFGNLPFSDAGTFSVPATISVSITNAGSLASGDPLSAIDAEKLTDIYLYLKYGL